MKQLLSGSLTGTWSSIMRADAKDMDMAFRRHTIYFCMVMLVDGVTCLLLQTAETVVQYKYLLVTTSSTLHSQNGYWNGGLLCLLALFGLTVSLFYPALRPSIFPLTESMPSSLLERTFRIKIRSFSILNILFLFSLSVCASSVTSIVLSVNAYPNFPLPLPPSNETSQYVRKTAFKRVRTACLTLEALLIWFNTLGLLFTILTAVVTLNRIVHYGPPPPPPPPPVPHRRRSSDSVVQVAPVSMPARLRKISAYVMRQKPAARERTQYGPLPHIGESNGSFHLDELHPTTSGFDESGGPIRSAGPSNPMLQTSMEDSEHRTQALTMLAEFLRNRKISRYQAPKVEQLEQTTTL
ncbi:hypothetical protein BV898_08430 [Hypsibius exemplaris]|uniref:Uncharacterized protein n=1 Tax=Hypsibius exemplaris TaxID=2072580 RepID=A0A1W0WQR6_HYPEX|nr:hypothetical protein BV898_08430 [Hypsibius exemplaris]